MRHHDYDDEPYVVIEKHSGGVGDFLLGVADRRRAWRCCSRRAPARETRADISRRARARAGPRRGRRRGGHGPGRRHVRGRARAVEEQIETARSGDRAQEASRCRARWRRDARRRSRRATISSAASPRPRRRTTPAPTSRGPAAPRRRSASTGRRGRRRLSRWPRRRHRGPSRHRTRAVVRLVSLGWTLRDYAKRVWDNAGEDNVLFLAGGIAFNILLAAVPFVLLLVSGLAIVLLNQSVEPNQLAVVTATSTACCPRTTRARTRRSHKLIERHHHAQRGARRSGAPIGFVWFSTRLFGSLRTVLANVFDIEQERGIIQGKIFDIKITILSTSSSRPNALISAYLAHRDHAQRATCSSALGIREDVMGHGEYALGRAWSRSC